MSLNSTVFGHHYGHWHDRPINVSLLAAEWTYLWAYMQRTCTTCKKEHKYTHNLDFQDDSHTWLFARLIIIIFR
jgi:hypothetical protein